MSESRAGRERERIVVIVQRVLPHYRVAFFSRLSRCLRVCGVRLRVVYGQELPGTVPRSVHPGEDWAQFVANRYWTPGGVEMVWQNCSRFVRSADLVIVEQANRLLVNYLFLMLRKFGRLRVAYWGHGRNLQSAARSSVRERLKLGILTEVDWWFAYTRLSAGIVSAAGYPSERITVVDNSIDTGEFKQAIEAVTQQQLEAIRERLGLGAGPVGLYCGGMYPDKHLSFLLEAAERLHDELGNFSLVVIGSGPDLGVVEYAAVRHPWIHYIGPRYGIERAVYFGLGDVMLMPGLVGLAIVDCFVAGLPMFTTDIPIHSPEIAYLENGRNGVMTSYSVEDYVASVVAYLKDADRMNRLRDGCRLSAGRYTLESMVEKFCEGVLACLDS